MSDSVDSDAPLIDLHSPDPTEPINVINNDQQINCDSAATLRPDCPICLSPSTFPVCLPCAHVFCFLCAKGALNNHKRCPVCRRPVPRDYFDNPHLLHRVSVDLINARQERWCYAGDSGWWLYDAQHSQEIEKAFTEGSRQLELLIADHMYVIDFQRMIQYRQRDPRRIRRIRRAEPGEQLPTKGIAGIKCVMPTDLIMASDLLTSLDPSSHTDQLVQSVQSDRLDQTNAISAMQSTLAPDHANQCEQT